MKTIISLISLIFLGMPVLTYSQQKEQSIQKLNSFIQNINTFNHLYPQEKVYLHFDNTGYYLGENIWFKAYVVVAEDNKPTILSRVLYVELLSPDGQIIETKKLMIENGQCHGDFLLKPDQYGGFFEVRAYTRLMLNWEETVFSRVFPVFDIPKEEGNYEKRVITEKPRSKKVPSQREEAKRGKAVNIDFFPEGGNLIAGLNSKLAFKATDKEGNGIEVRGNILNEQEEVITSFSTSHNGMGYFAFTPEKAAGYSVNTQYEGKIYTFKLPEILSSGYVMNVDNIRNEFTFVNIQKTSDQINEIIGLSVSCRGKVYVFETLDTTQKNEYLLKIPKSALPTGVNQITLFTQEGEILSERLIFINHQDQGIITAKQNKIAYHPYEKIEMGLSVEDNEGNPQNATFSLSITDAKTSTLNQQGSLYSNLLLSSELRGYIENLDYYFEADDNIHRSASDLLMMIQGWRRYSWKQMAGVEPFELKHHIEKGIVIDGQVLSLQKKKEKENVEVSMWMYSDEGSSQQGTCMTDKEGRFNFLPNDFYGEWDLSLQTKEDGKRKDHRILLDRQFSPPPRSYSFFDIKSFLLENKLDKKPLDEEKLRSEELGDLDLDKDSISYIQPSSNLLPEVKVTKKRGSRKNALTTTYEVGKEIERFEDTGENYRMGILDFLASIDEYFTYEITQVDNPKYSKRESKGLHITYFYKEQIDIVTPRDLFYDLRYKGKPVSVIINGRNFDYREPDITFANQIKDITITQRSGVDMPYNDGGGSSGILINFHTYEDNRVASSPKGIRLTKLQGYSNIKEFFSPDYSNGILPDEKDYRRTLYWNPNVITDNKGKASVTFYNNGSCTEMNINAEGINPEGIPFILNK